jgi:hypothetical protein
MNSTPSNRVVLLLGIVLLHLLDTVVQPQAADASATQCQGGKFAFKLVKRLAADASDSETNRTLHVVGYTDLILFKQNPDGEVQQLLWTNIHPILSRVAVPALSKAKGWDVFEKPDAFFVCYNAGSTLFVEQLCKASSSNFRRRYSLVRETSSPENHFSDVRFYQATNAEVRLIVETKGGAHLEWFENNGVWNLDYTASHPELDRFRAFQELAVFDMEGKSWKLIQTNTNPPPALKPIVKEVAPTIVTNSPPLK